MGALKSSLIVTAGGKGPEIRPSKTAIRRPAADGAAAHEGHDEAAVACGGAQPPVPAQNGRPLPQAEYTNGQPNVLASTPTPQGDEQEAAAPTPGAPADEVDALLHELHT